MSKCSGQLPFILVPIFVVLTAFNVQADNYVVTEIARLSPASSYSWPQAINNQGQVVGYGATAAGNHGFVWSIAAGIRDLGDLPGGDDISVASDINNQGQIVGTGSTATGKRAVLWSSDGSMQDLGELPGGIQHSEGNGINDAGYVTGMSHNADGARGFIWNASSGMQAIAGLPAMSSDTAFSINRYNQIAGMASDGTVLTGFRWDNASGIQDLGDLPSGEHVSYAYAINDDNFVVGRGNVTAGDRGVMWRPDGSMQELSILPAGINSYAYDINNAGFIVGDATGSLGHRAVVWNDPRGLPTDLNNSIVPGSGWILVSAYAVNDVGQIAGMGISPGGLFTGFMLSPQPSVTSIWPSNAVPGETLFVFGAGFVPQQTQVSINGIAMNLVQWMSPNLLLVRLPTNVTPGSVEVSTDYGNALSPLDYGVLPSGVDISGVWPQRSAANHIIFVFGAGFSDPNLQLKLNGSDLFMKQVVNDSLLLFLLPPGMSSGPVEVITQEGQAISQYNFVIL